VVSSLTEDINGVGMAADLQAMAQGLGQRIPLSQLGLAGPAPSGSNARGGPPGGVDPLALLFQSLETMLKRAQTVLKSEGRPKSVRMSTELASMAVEISKMSLDHQADFQATQPQATQQGSAQPNIPNVNAMAGPQQ